MPRQPLSNLINGVSQQPTALRRDNQFERMVNHFPTVLEHLGRRPPLELIAKVSDTPLPSTAFIHPYTRDSNESYFLSVDSTGDVRAVDFTGDEKTLVDGTGVATYLASSKPWEGLFALTYQDTTFIGNRNTVVAKDAATSPSRTPEALVFITQGQPEYNVTLSITHASTTYTRTYTWGSTGAITPVSAITDFDTYFTANLPGSFIVEFTNHVLYIAHPTDDFTVEIEDTYNNTLINAVQESVPEIADLPSKAPHGFVAIVSNSEDRDADDTYYRFDAFDETLGNVPTDGIWKETVAPNQQNAFDADTMPIQVQRTNATTFTSSQPAWGERAVGNEAGNPDPSFVGKTLDNLGIVANRLGFLSGDSYVFSRVGDENFFEFYRETMTTGLDTDPIDDILYNRGGIFEAQHLFSKDPGELLIFGKNDEVAISWGNRFAPGQTTDSYPTNVGSSPAAIPKLTRSKSALLVVKNEGEFSSVNEYFVDNISGNKEAANITEHVPRYIPKDVVAVAGIGSSAEFLLSNEERDTLYVYNYSWQGNTKVQLAWHKWNFVGLEIMGIHSIGNVLYLLYNQAGKLFLGSIDCNPRANDPGIDDKILIDHRFQDDSTGVTVTYDQATGKTTVTCPYDLTGRTIDDLRVYVRQDTTVSRGSDSIDFAVGQSLGEAIESVGASSFVMNGIFSDVPFFAGFKLDSEAEFSRQYLREVVGEQQRAETSGSTNLDSIELEYTRTGYLELQVQDNLQGKVFRSHKVSPWGTDIARKKSDGSFPQLEGSDRFNVGLKTADARVIIKNDTALPHYVTGAIVDLTHNPRGRG